MIYRRPYPWFMLIAVLACLGVAETAESQVRIVSYNTLDKPLDSTADAQFRTIFDAIGTETVNGIARPVDVLTLQEQRVFNFNSSTAHDMANELNALYGVSSYQAIVSGSGFDRLGIVYNSATVDLLSSQVIPVGIRPGLRAQFRPTGYTSPESEFYVYSAHFKAGTSSSDISLRATEANNLRNNAATLGADANVIYTGDFNVKSGSEGGYQNFFVASDAKAVDPTGVSSWGFGTADLLTQSTRVSGLSDGGAGGGMDDRFDFQLVTEEVADGEGFAIITPGSTGAATTSYRAFGNDGNTFNQSINSNLIGRSQPVSVLDALFQFSDHLPVVADYQLPAKLSLTTTATTEADNDQVFVGGGAAVFGIIDNIAPVAVDAGADEMDYSIIASGDVAPFPAYTGSLTASDTPNSHVWVYDTSTAGDKTATLEYTSQSTGVSDTQLQRTISVFDHAEGSFDAFSSQQSLTLDFGTLNVGQNGGSIGETFDLFNLESTPGFTSALDVGTWSAVSGDTANFDVLDLPGTVDAGDSLLQIASVDTSAAGSFSSTWEVTVGDALNITGAQSSTLTLTLVADIVSQMLLGDFDGNNVVESGDLGLVLNFWGTTVASGQSPGGDWVNAGNVTGDIIDSDELALVLNNWGSTSPVMSQMEEIMFATGLTEGQVLALVPEPGTAGLLAAAGLLVLRRSRRRA